MDLLVEKESDEGGGGMVALPDWYVSACPWAAGALALAAVARTVRPHN